jgi:hypothetical protein
MDMVWVFAASDDQNETNDVVVTAFIAKIARFAHLSAEMFGGKYGSIRRIDILCRREARLLPLK